MKLKRTGLADMRYAPVCIVLLLLVRSAWPLELQTVLDNIAITPPARVGFREERHNKLLKDPLVLTGYLEYPGEGRLRKVVETPFHEAFLVDGDRIEIERDGATRTLSLNRSRSLQTLLSGIEAILSGRTDRLKRIFNHELTGSDTDWTLHLVPGSSRIARQLHSLTVTGDADSIGSIRFDLDDDEWYLMHIGKTDPKR